MITIKLEGIEEAMKALDPNKVRSAARMAINTAASQGRPSYPRQVQPQQ